VYARVGTRAGAGERERFWVEIAWVGPICVFARRVAALSCEVASTSVGVGRGSDFRMLCSVCKSAEFLRVYCCSSLCVFRFSNKERESNAV